MEKLVLQDLQFAYPKQAPSAQVFAHLDLEIAEGEFVAVMGPSGCGKSTLLHLLAGLEQAQGGALLMDGKPISGPGTDRGIVFQDYSLFPWMTAGRNIAFCAMQADRTLTRRQAEDLAGDYLARVGLEDAAEVYPAALSGGMRQRVAIAKMLAMSPSVLLFDEPFGALDPETRIRLQCLLEHIWAEQTPHRTVVFVTHDIDEALLLADRVVFLEGGLVQDSFPVPFSRPRDREQLMTPQACALRKRCMRRFNRSAGCCYE